jgi:hypothetical protein
MLTVGNKRLLLGRALLAAGTNYIQTGLRNIINADVIPIADAGGTAQTVLCKHSTAEGTEGDAPESGFLTIEGADAVSYYFMVWGW